MNHPSGFPTGIGNMRGSSKFDGGGGGGGRALVNTWVERGGLKTVFLKSRKNS